MLDSSSPPSAPAMAAVVSARGDQAAVVLRRLRSLGHAAPETEALIGTLTDFQTLRAGAELAAECDPVSQPRVLIAGWAARVRSLPDGRRQILTFILPGETIGLSLRQSPLALCATVALTSVQLLGAGAVQRAVDSEDPRWDDLREAVHVAASYEEAFLLSQIQRLGRQTAHERMCHLLLELRDRLAMAGVGDEQRFPMPLTQEVLADATGLSIVHVNRILQQLRRERLLDLRGGYAQLPDLAAIRALADYRRPAPTCA